MLGDQAGRDHLIGEGFVDGKGLAAGRLFQFIDGAAETLKNSCGSSPVL